MKYSAAVCALLFIFSAAATATGKDKIAFIEFQNKAGTIIQTNRWTMADDLAKRVHKRVKKVEILSRKQILKQIKEPEWMDDRLSDTQETVLEQVGAKYIVYGDIVHWRIHGQYSNTEVQDASEANVIFAIRVVDVLTNRTVKSFAVDGRATGETGKIVEGDPASFTEQDDADLQLYDATEIALNKAADILVETFLAQH